MSESGEGEGESQRGETDRTIPLRSSDQFDGFTRKAKAICCADPALCPSSADPVSPPSGAKCTSVPPPPPLRIHFCHHHLPPSSFSFFIPPNSLRELYSPYSLRTSLHPLCLPPRPKLRSTTRQIPPPARPHSFISFIASEEEEERKEEGRGG